MLIFEQVRCILFIQKKLDVYFSRVYSFHPTFSSPQGMGHAITCIYMRLIKRKGRHAITFLYTREMEKERVRAADEH